MGAALGTIGNEADRRTDAHGTEVASLIVSAAPGASLYVADIYCGRPAGGGVSALIGALSWLAQSNVSVINISLVGPPNRALVDPAHLPLLRISQASRVTTTALALP